MDSPSRGPLRFDEHDRSLFGELAGSMKFVGGSSIVIAAVTGWMTVTAFASLSPSYALAVALYTAPACIAGVVMGVLHVRSASGFSQVSRSESDAAEPVIYAARSLSWVFAILRVLVIALTVAFAVSVVWTLVAMRSPPAPQSGYSTYGGAP